MDKKLLYDWVFHYNHYTKLWNAAKRDDRDSLFSNNADEKVLRSSNIDTLIEIICRTKGNKDQLNKLTNEQRTRN